MITTNTLDLGDIYFVTFLNTFDVMPLNVMIAISSPDFKEFDLNPLYNSEH